MIYGMEKGAFGVSDPGFVAYQPTQEVLGIITARMP
jgi:hypothetical protein